jgi:hypothetical protein
MECPKCGSICRNKMTGAICLNNKCNWYTHDINNIKVINNEINNSEISKKFKLAEANQISEDYENMYGFGEL